MLPRVHTTGKALKMNKIHHAEVAVLKIILRFLCVKKNLLLNNYLGYFSTLLLMGFTVRR